MVALLLLILTLSSCNPVHTDPTWDDLGLRFIHLNVSEDTYNQLFSTVFTNEWSRARFRDSRNSDTQILIRRQGNDARTLPKPSFTIEIGGRRLILSSQYHEESFVRYRLADYFFRKAGFVTGSLEPVVVMLNSTYLGLYLIREPIDANFFVDRGFPVNALYRVELGGELTRKNGLTTQHSFTKKLPHRCNSYTDIDSLVTLIDKGLSEEYTGSEIDKMLNIENALKYYAVSQIINNTDGYKNNYILIHSQNSNSFEFIPWDLDKTFRAHGDQLPIFKNGLFEQFHQPNFIKKIDSIQNAFFNFDESIFMLYKYAEEIEKAYQTDPFFNERESNLWSEIEKIKSSLERAYELLEKRSRS